MKNNSRKQTRFSYFKQNLLKTVASGLLLGVGLVVLAAGLGFTAPVVLVGVGLIAAVSGTIALAAIKTFSGSEKTRAPEQALGASENTRASKKTGNRGGYDYLDVHDRAAAERLDPSKLPEPKNLAEAVVYGGIRRMAEGQSSFDKTQPNNPAQEHNTVPGENVNPTMTFGCN